MTRTLVIVGGGIGGLSAAIRLAAQGHQVTIIEQNDVVGGKMSEIVIDGFRWDTGPSVITMRPVFDELFQSAGKDLRDYLTLLPVDPLTRYFWNDGAQLDASRMPHIMLQRLREFAGEEDAQGYMRYLQYAKRIHDITGPVFIYNDPPTVWRVARTPLKDIPAVDPLRTMAEAIDSFVASPKLRQMLERFATYVGASPFSAPATLNVIAHVELSGGVWYPQGGIYSIARALEKLARELGVNIVTECHADEITVEDHKVTGVRADGTFFPADAVIANVDVATVYERLLPQDTFNPRRLARLENAELSSSGFVLLMGIEGVHEQLTHHNILFSDDYPREFTDIFERGVPPDDPTIYIAITSKTDAPHAPRGCENWFVMVNVPATSERFDWATQGDAYRDRILEVLAARGLNILDKIKVEHRLTPLDFEARTGARHGAIYGLSSNDRFNALRRPHNRAPDIRGLYFVGGTTHPGGGVPMVMLSGKVAANLALEDLEHSLELRK